MTAPKRLPAAAGKSPTTLTLVRLRGSSANVCSRRRAVLEVERHSRRRRERRRVGDQDVGLGALRPAHFAFGQRPARARRGRARRVVRLGPEAAVSAGLGHHIVRSTMIGTPLVEVIVLETATLSSGLTPEPRRNLLVVHPDGEAAVGRHRVALRVRRAVEQQVVDA